MKYLKLTALAILLLQTNLFAQQIKLKEKQTDDKGKITFAVPENSLISTPENEILLLDTLVAPEKRLTFRLVKTIGDDKFQHNYYNFSFMNLEIVGSDYVVHSSNGKVLFANGNLPSIKDSSYQKIPRINFEQVQSLLYNILVTGNKNPKPGNIKKVINKGLVWFYRQYELSLAYEVEVNSANPLQSGTYIIDAING